MSATQGRSRLVGVVDGEAGGTLLGEGHIDGSTGADTVVGGGCIVGPQARLDNVTGTQLDHLEQTVLEADGVVVAQEGVGGESRRQGEALVPLLEEEVVGEADVEAGGKLHLGSAGLDGEVVAGGIDHLQGEAGATELHGGTPVLEGDTELELIIVTSDVLDTGVDTEAGTGHVVGTLGDYLEVDSAVDGVGEAVGISHIDIHVRGGEGAVHRLRAEDCGDIDISKTHSHDIDTGDTAVEDADAETEGVDGSAAGEAALASVEHGVGVAHLDAFDESETGHVGEHGTEAAHIGDIDATPTGVACPRIDEQLGTTGSATALVVAGQGRLRREGREDHNYSKYSKYVFHLCIVFVVR